MSFCSLLLCHMTQSWCFHLSGWNSMLHCVCLAFLEGSLTCINLCHRWLGLRMSFQMRSASSASAFTPVSAGQVLLGASFDYIYFFGHFYHIGSWWSSGINVRDKSSLCIVTFSNCVISTNHWESSFFACHHWKHYKTWSLEPDNSPFSTTSLQRFLCISIAMPIFIIFRLTSSFLERYLLPFLPWTMGYFVGEIDQSNMPQSILHFIQFRISSHVFPCSVSQMCSPVLRAVEARQMGMSLLGSLVLQSQAGSWSSGFNIKILVCIPVVACTASLIVLGCRFRTPADWHVFNSLNFAPQIPQMWWFTCLAPPCPYWKWRQSIHFILRPHSELMGFSFPSWSYLSLTFGSFGFSSLKHLLIDPFSHPVAGLCAVSSQDGGSHPVP